MEEKNDILTEKVSQTVHETSNNKKLLAKLTKNQITSAIQFLGLDGKKPRIYYNKNEKHFLQNEYISFRKIFFGFKCFYEENNMDFTIYTSISKFHVFLQDHLRSNGIETMADRTFEISIARLTPLFIIMKGKMTKGGYRAKLIKLNDLGLVVLGFKKHPEINGYLFEEKENANR